MPPRETRIHLEQHQAQPKVECTMPYINVIVHFLQQ